MIVIVDKNSKVGKGGDGKPVDQFGLVNRNERGKKFVEWCVTKPLRKPGSKSMPDVLLDGKIQEKAFETKLTALHLINNSAIILKRTQCH